MVIYERDFKIIVPRTTVKNVSFVAKNMSNQFGGVTLHPQIQGLWLDDKGTLVADKNIMFFSSRDFEGRKNKEAILKKDRKFMRELALAIGKKTKQDAIWIEEDIVKDVSFVTIPKNSKRLKEVM